MITTYELFQLNTLVMGLCAGFAYGLRFGILCGIVGGIVGSFLGCLVGYLPWGITQWFVFRNLRRKTASQLWEHLQDGSGPANFIAYELRRRGEPARKVLDAILAKLASEDFRQRHSGRVALNWAFPEATKYALAFKPGSSKEERQEGIEEIEKFLREAASEKCPVAGDENR